MGTNGPVTYSSLPADGRHEKPQALAREASGHKGHKQSRLLEGILTNTSIPLFRRLWSARGIEMKLLVHLAVPAMVVYMLNYVMSMATQIFSGHLGNLKLSAISLGNTCIQIFAYSLMEEHLLICIFNQHSDPWVRRFYPTSSQI